MMPLKSWQHCWRECVAPQLPTVGLQQLLLALETFSDSIVQGKTCTLDSNNQPIHACAIAYALWKGQPDSADLGHIILDLFDQVAEAARKHYGYDVLNYFTSWFDYNPKQLVFPALAEEVRLELLRRGHLNKEDVWLPNPSLEA